VNPPPNAIGETDPAPKSGPRASWFKRVRRDLRITIQRQTTALQGGFTQPGAATQQAAVKAGVASLSSLEARLANPLLRIAVFGLVSRGKSAVINALLGEALLPTGPLHGVTRWPRSVYWRPKIEAVHDGEDLPQIELIDTPGLDEVEGEARGAMAQEVAHQADLILFVVAGDITRTEYEALVELQTARKPLVLVFNKIDLYPDTDRQAIVDTLTKLWRQGDGQDPNVALSVDEIVRVAAAPASLQVRVEWPDGQITHEWETPAPDIAPLKTALVTIARQDGTALIALNALREADHLETEVARRAMALHQADADALILKFAKYKAIAVAFNPIAVLDLAGGFVTDLVMIRSLAKLYGLPITQHETRKLWGAIAKSTGTLLLSELGSGLLMGMGKSAAAAWSLFDGAAGGSALIGAMATQAAAAGYGTYAVGKAAQIYLERGCTWGPEGVKAMMQDILSQIDTDSTVSRLRQEIEAEINAALGNQSS
jgi:small GTP-binding protein